MRGQNGRINKFGITDRPLKERERENQLDGIPGKIRPESGLLTRQTAIQRERDKIDDYKDRTGRRPPGNKP